MKAKIANISFLSFKAERRSYGGRYAISGVAKGAAPEFLAVPDMVQRWQGSYALGDGNSRRQTMSARIPGEQIARDIVSEWARQGLGMNEHVHPGIWVVRESLPLIEEGQIVTDPIDGIVWRPAEEEERKAMWAEDLAANLEADRKYAEYLIESGDRMVQKDKRLTSHVPPNCKLAAVHYGQMRDWVQGMTSSNMGPCPVCRKIISLEAMKCPDCSEVIDIPRYAAYVAKREEAVKMARRSLEQVPRVPKGMGLRSNVPAEPTKAEEELEEDMEPAQA